jgi:hypothetical protein
MNKHLERISRDAGVDDLPSVLSERIEPADLHSLLLDVHRRHAARRSPSAVLAEYESNRFLRMSAVDPRAYHVWDGALHAALPEDAEPVELSPLAPLGSCSVVAGMSQDMSLVSSRNLEIVSDATNVLALECAVRRRSVLAHDRRSDRRVMLAASHRLLRPHAPNLPGYTPHFRLFGICSAGRNEAEKRFHETALEEHLGVLVDALRRYLGPRNGLRVVLTELDAAEPSERWREAADRIRRSSGVEVVFDQSRETGRSYYREICFHLYFGETQLADGGGVDWSARLLSNARERMFISGIGSDRVCALATMP